MLRSTTIYLPRALYEKANKTCLSSLLKDFLARNEIETMLSTAFQDKDTVSKVCGDNDKIRYHLKTDASTLNSLRNLSAEMNATLSDLASMIIYISMHEEALRGLTIGKILCRHFGDEYQHGLMEFISTFLGEYDEFNHSNIMKQIHEKHRNAINTCIDYIDEVMGFLVDRYGAQRLMSFIKNMELVDAPIKD
ncbi:MAG: hypothetical protein ACP5NY_00135 [Thermocladium sp.]